MFSEEVRFGPAISGLAENGSLGDLRKVSKEVDGRTVIENDDGRIFPKSETDMGANVVHPRGEVNLLTIEFVSEALGSCHLFNFEKVVGVVIGRKE